MKTVYIISRKINNAESFYTGKGWSDLKIKSHEFITPMEVTTKLEAIIKNPAESDKYYEILTCYKR